MLNEFLESFRARFVVSSIIRMKFFFHSSFNCITFKWLNLESIIIFRSSPFVITFVSSSYWFVGIVIAHELFCQFFDKEISISHKMIIYTISWDIVSISSIAFYFIDLPHRSSFWLMTTKSNKLLERKAIQ